MEKTSKRPSLNQLAELIAERAGRKYDLAFKEEVKVMIHYWRQRIMVDSLNSKPEDREFFKVWFDMELIDVSISDFPGFPKSMCVRRTKDCLPSPLRANSTIVDFVGYLNKETRIPMSTSLATAKIMMESKYTGGKPRAVYMNGYIFVFSYPGPGISIAMIPEDMSQVPSKGLECVGCGSNSDICYTDDAPYPISGDMAQRVVQAILATELNRNIIDPKQEQLPVANNEK